jgi:hypothetical protein
MRQLDALVTYLVNSLIAILSSETEATERLVQSVPQRTCSPKRKTIRGY